MRTQIYNDQELVRQYIDGREKALEMLINRHKDKVYTTIYMFVKDRYLAEDLFQNTFIKVVDTLKTGRYKEEGKFLPWVSRIAHNLCIDYYRKTKRTPKVTTCDGYDIFEILRFSTPTAQDDIIKNETNKKVRVLIDELPPEQKEVVVLRHYASMSFKEIAELTDVSINTALGRMRYALINLRKIIEQKEISL